MMVSSAFEDYADPERPSSYALLQGPTPPISISMNLSSSVHSLKMNHAGLPKLQLTLTSHLQQPITICTYRTALEPRMAWHTSSIFQNFIVTDIETGQHVFLPPKYVNRRCTLRRQIGRDESYYLTLSPDVPVTVSSSVRATGWYEREPGTEIVKPRGSHYGGEEFRRYLEPGHTYTIGLKYRPGAGNGDCGIPEPSDDQLVLWWRYGTKEEVLEPPDAPFAVTEQGWSENKIRFKNIPEVQLHIEE